MGWAASPWIIHIYIHIHLLYQQAKLTSENLLRCSSQNHFLVLQLMYFTPRCLSQGGGYTCHEENMCFYHKDAG